MKRMGITISLYTTDENEIQKFLDLYYEQHIEISDKLRWEHYYENPIQSIDFIGTFIDNNDKFRIRLWISLDSNFYLNVTDYNVDKIIRYLYERYPN